MEESGRQKLLKDPSEEAGQSEPGDNSELKFCLSWCIITTGALVVVALIMIVWLNTLHRSTVVDNSFIASMFNFGGFRKPIILMWTTFFGAPLLPLFEPTKQCPYQCVFTDDRSLEASSRIRIFHARDLSAADLPRNNIASLNVFFSMEPPVSAEFKWNHITDLTLRREFFNLTVTYQQDSSIQYPYDVFEPRNGREEENDYYTDEQVEQAIDNKTELVMISMSTCRTDSKREILVEQLQQMLPITAVGDCFDVNCNDTCLEDMEREHYFYLAFESSVCPDYVSEKLWRLKRLIVPVVLSRSVVPSYIPSYTVIAVDDFPTLQHFVNYLFRVAKDREMYKSYFAWTKLYRKTSRRAREFMDPGCELCKIAYRQQRHFLKNFEKYISHNQCKHAYSTYLLTDRRNKTTWEL